MLNNTIRHEINHLLRSFVGAMAAALVIAAMHWASMEVPVLLHWLAIGGASYAGSKTMQ